MLIGLAGITGAGVVGAEVAGDMVPRSATRDGVAVGAATEWAVALVTGLSTHQRILFARLVLAFQSIVVFTAGSVSDVRLLVLTQLSIGQSSVLQFIINPSSIALHRLSRSFTKLRFLFARPLLA